MNVVDVKTGRTSVNPDKLFKKDGDTILGCYHNTRGLWQIAHHPGKNSLYVPFHDQCLTMQAVNASPTGFGRRTGVRRPGSDSKAYMGMAKIDVATGEMRVIYSQAQGTNGSAAVSHERAARADHQGHAAGRARTQRDLRVCLALEGSWIYFKRSATLAIPALEQASSISSVDPALPTAPIVSLPT